MPKYMVTFNTTISVAMDVEAEDDDLATDMAWELAEEFLRSACGNSRYVRADATLDGIAADTVTELAADDTKEG